MIKWILSLFFVLIISSFLRAQDTLIFQPGPEEGKDAKCWTYNPYANSGGSIDFQAEEWTYFGIPFSANGLIEFDLGMLEDNVTIIAASLSLFYNSLSPSNTNVIGHSQLSGTNEAYLSRIVSPWEEYEVTYNTLPNVSEINRVTLPASDHPFQDYTDIEITRMVRDALNDGQDFIGMIIDQVVHSYYRRLLFCSSDHPDPAKRPRLKIIYEICDSPVAYFEYVVAEEMTVDFTDLSLNADSYLWDLGNGNFSSQASPTVVYGDYGEYIVCLEAGNECGSSVYCDTIRICKGPEASFQYELNNLTVHFTNTSQDAESYRWEFGNGDISEEISPIVNYESIGDYVVCLEAINECDTSVMCDTLTICNKPIALFEYDKEDLAVHFRNTSIYGDSCLWDFGNGYYSSQEDPHFTFDDYKSYAVCMEVINNCGSSVYCDTLTLCKLPNVGFEYFTDDLHVTFHDLSVECDSVSWDLGNGFLSYVPNPNFSYDEEGSYEVCLIGFNACGSRKICNTVTVKKEINPHDQPIHAELYPNPTRNHSYLEISRSGTFLLSFYSIEGKKIFEEEIENETGVKNLIYTDLFSPGFYIVKVQSEQLNKQFILVKTL